MINDDFIEELAEKAIDVLIVEDSETQAKYLANLLASQGYLTRIAGNGVLGLAEARKRKPTLILSDISMPEMDGFALCQELKKDDNLRDVPVILLTALTSLYDVLKALDCGADNFIRKPFEKKYLLGRIRHILANRATRGEERVQLGMRISLGGQTHFITAERQQIFDLLISTYEEAIQMTAELRSQQEVIARSYESLEGLYRMADALNPAITEQSVLQCALERALEVPDIVGGRIMLLDHENRLRTRVSDNFLPDGDVLALESECRCRQLLVSKKLRFPQVMNDCALVAPQLRADPDWGSHVAVPLVIGERVLGVMNLRGTDDRIGGSDNMQLFDAMGKQVAIALERASLYANMEALVKERTDALEIERNLLSVVVDTAGALVLLVDAKGRIVMFNPACEKALGWKLEEVRDRYYWDVFLPPTAVESRRAFFGSLSRPDVPTQIAGEYLARDGSTRHIIWTTSHVQKSDESIEYFLGTGIDVTDLKRAEENLQFLRNFDMLTGLPNRVFLMARLRLLEERGLSENQLLGFLVVSFARLPAIRESLGSKVEQALTVEAARRLKTWVKGEDSVARLGDHAFAIVVQRAGPDDISATAREVLSLLDEPFTVESQEVHLDARAGITIYPTDGKDTDGLIQQAEIAMQRALASGTERYAFYTQSLNQRAKENFQLENDLRQALKRDEFFLHYQPQLDLATGKVIGLEALIRWNHPSRGLIPPGRFIPLAEDTGLILAIGEWVLRTACAQTRSWQDDGLGTFRIAVNLSAHQFAQKSLASQVASILKETGLPPHRLDLELTESMVMQDVEHAIEVLNELRQLGVQMSIDDFGTGYSSLAYLKRFPIDVLKIDRSFVCEINSDPNDAAIADAIISMAHSLGVKVIAEGVETEAQCQFLARNMCDAIQGYMYSRPLAADAMAALLREERGLGTHLLRMHKPPRTLLLVDDEPAILSALLRKLRGKGYLILTASSGSEGLDILAGNEVDVIVSDQRMPGMTGVDFLRTVKTLYPDTVRIVLSGFTELQSVTDAVNEGAIYKFLTKPWEDDQLLQHIEEAFEHKEMVNENRRLNLEIRTANQNLARANRQLEEVLAQQERQIRFGEVSLDIVREALQYVPLPVIGLDDEHVVVFANGAAQELIGRGQVLLAAQADKELPDLVQAVRAARGDAQPEISIHGKRWKAVVREMGNATRSRGTLITLMPL